MSTNQLSTRDTFSLRPKTLDEAMKFAKIISDSDLCPKDYRGKPSNVLVAVQMGAELGLSPMQAIQNIAVINGRPCLWGDALLAICSADPSFENMHEEIKNDTAYCTVKRRHREPLTRSFSTEQAKRAGLLGKPGVWQNYKDRMLQMRARGFALRDGFADILKGLITREEAQDIDREVKINKADALNKKIGLTTEELKVEPEVGKALVHLPETFDHETGEVLLEGEKTDDDICVDHIRTKMSLAKSINELIESIDLVNMLPTSQMSLKKELMQLYRERQKELG